MMPSRRRIFSLLTTVALFAALRLASAANLAPAHFILELEAKAERDTPFEIFYDNGYGYSATERASADLHAGTWQTVRLTVPPAPLKRLRIDPANGDMVVHLRRVRLLTDEGLLVHNLDVTRLRPTNQIASLEREGDGMIVRPTAGANDPTLLVAEPLHEIMHRWLGGNSLGRPMLALFGSAVLVLALLATVAAARAAVAASGLPRARGWQLGAAVFLAVWGARLTWLLGYGRALPYWDEWNGDGLYLLAPFQGGYLDWSALFLPQNEHRIVLQRLITLLGTLANGEWDPRVAMTLGATAFAGGIALVATLLQAAGRRVGLAGALALVLLTSLPYDPANFFWGGQVQMYALVFFALCTLALACTPAPDRLTVAGAAAAGLLILGTMGSGFVVPGVAAALCAWRARREPAVRRPLIGMAVILTGCAILGLCGRVDSNWLAPTYAHSWAEFWRAFQTYAAWPLSPHWGCLLLLWLPWVAAVVSLLRRKEKISLDWFVLGLGAWTVVNLAGVARGRPDVALVADTRYFTTFSFTVVTGLLSLGSLAAAGRRSARWLALPVAIGVCAVGLFGYRGIVQVRQNVAIGAAQDQLVRRYLSTGDRSVLVDPPPGASPFWNSQELGVILDSPPLQPLLPAPLRRALASRTGASVAPIEAGPVTLTVRTLMKLGPLFCAVGWALLGAGAWRSRPGRFA